MTQAFLSPEEAAQAWEDGADPDAYQVLALDPGGVTGWALFQVHPDAMTGDPEIPLLANVEWWTAGQIVGARNEQIDQLMELIEQWPAARLVTEKFVPRAVGVVMEPDRINAVLDYLTRPRYWVYQDPSLAMSTVTDDRQKSWGYWMPGKEHARDAIKHAITFLKRRKESEVNAARKLAAINRRAG